MLGLGLSLPALAVRRPSGEAFSPASLFAAGEQGVWYDPSDLSTMFQDDAGTTPVTAAGQAVARINDKSGRGNHATQDVTARRPILRQTAGGLWYLEFDGIDDWLATGTITPGTDKAQLFAGVRKLSDANAGILCELTSVSTNPGALSLFAGGGTAVRRFSYSTAAPQAFIGTADFPAPVTVVNSLIIDRSGSTTATILFPRLNGNSVTISELAEANPSGNFAIDQLFIGVRRFNTVLHFNGHLYSLIARFGPNLDIPTIQQAEAWIAARTGVTL